MIKILTLATLLAGLSLPAHARSPRAQVDSQDFAVEKCTSTTVAVSSQSATDVLASSVYLSSATFFEIYNINASTAVNCGFQSNVSTISTSYLYGREIGSKTGIGYTLNLDKFHETGYWCLGQDVTASLRATITKCR